MYIIVNMSNECIYEKLIKEVCKSRIDRLGTWMSHFDKEYFKQMIDNAVCYRDLCEIMAGCYVYDNYIYSLYCLSNPHTRMNVIEGRMYYGC